MGYQRETYIGAYLLATVKFTMKKSNILVCLNHPVEPIPRSSNFCPHCGSKLAPGPDLKAYPTLCDILPEPKYEDKLIDAYLGSDVPPDTLILLSNLNIKEHPVKLDTQFSYGCLEVTPNAILKCTHNFETQYEDIIKILRNRVAFLNLQFGVVTWYS